MTKTAIFFSGRIRAFDEVKEHLIKLNLIENTIFFVSLNLEKSNEEAKQFCKLMNINDPICMNFEKTIIPEIMYTFNMHYHSVREKVYSMFYHNFRCFELITNYQNKYNMKFNTIVKYRADFNTSNILPLNHELKENTVYRPYNLNYTWGDDKVAYGNYESMKKYCNVVNNIISLCGDDKILYHPETLLDEHLKKENLNIENFEFVTYLVQNRYL